MNWIAWFQYSKSKIHPHVVDMQQLNQELSTLKDMSPVAAESLHRPVEDANGRWNGILKTIANREVMYIAFSDLQRTIFRGCELVTCSWEAGLFFRDHSVLFFRDHAGALCS